MKQILHIFRKDVRHHWPEIFASLVLLVAFTAEQPRIWLDPVYPYRILTFLINALPALLFVSWAFVIVRLVHDESLVGDRQFWTTRPYQWPKLFAAKLLSIFLFIHVPLFLAQSFLLLYGHFPVVSSTPNLLYVHTLFLFVLIFPVLALATVTAGTGAATLALLAIMVFTIAVAAIYSALPDSQLSSDALDGFLGLSFAITCAGVPLLQYARRKVWLARSWIVVTAVVMATISFAVPQKTLLESQFPLASADKPIPAQFSLDPSLLFVHPKDSSLGFSRETVSVEIPLQVSVLVENAVVEIYGATLEVQLPNGERQTSHWQPTGSNPLLYGRTRYWSAFTIKRDLFNHLRSAPVTAHLTLAMKVFKKVRSTDIEVKSDGFELTKGVHCASRQLDGELHCFAAFRVPGPLLVTADLPTPDCQSQQSMSSGPYADFPATYSNLNTNTSPEFSLDPVEKFSIAASKLQRFEDASVNVPICPGTTLALTTVQFAYDTRVNIELGEIDVLDYVPSYPRKIRRRSGVSEAPPPDSATWLFDGKPEYEE